MCRLKFRPCENKVLILALRNGREQKLLPFKQSTAMCRLKFRPCENKVLTLAFHNGREQMLLPFKQSTAMCRLKLRPCENKVLTSALRNGREQMIIIFITLYSVSVVEKVCFFKNSEISLSLTPNPFPPERG
ncbi:hypothetical protein ES1_05810 [[Eubacterium] siraeum V10Sc8a]|uniref:Uncharacterized protein n=1 Tax=[Eubacterium] siraeum V10Sc8a TaxID=717961 RepID=D4MIW9_9FIRM|nr:hypothetical protein ES1_05810 [[Eubacterium] siraeum V10Sc8a]